MGLTLTRENYYTAEADREYFSCSQYQAFCECEAKAVAKLEGRWVDPPNEAFTVGNYFHTYFEGPEAHAQFCAENADKIYKKQTKKAIEAGEPPEKYAPYALADKMIDVALEDSLIRSLVDLPGENEKIMAGELFGVPWKIRVDKYIPDGRMILDYKTVANIGELRWSDEWHSKVTFLDAYGYLMRAAVYAEIEKQVTGETTDPDFIIIAISKQDYPDKDVLYLNHRERWDYELAQIKERIQTFRAVKEGHIVPRRCGYCDYCRATKKLFAIRPYYKLMPEYRDKREDDYAAGIGQGMAESQEG